jgi:hypothetical protein
MSPHGRTWRTDRGRYSCDHRRRLNRARTIEAAFEVSVTPQRTPFTLTGSFRTVAVAGLLIQKYLFQDQGLLRNTPRLVGNEKRRSVQEHFWLHAKSPTRVSRKFRTGNALCPEVIS